MNEDILEGTNVSEARLLPSQMKEINTIENDDADLARDVEETK